MTIEATLQSIDNHLSAIHQTLLSGGAKMLPIENIDAGAAAVAGAGLTGAQLAPLEGGAGTKTDSKPKRGTGKGKTSEAPKDPLSEIPAPKVSDPGDFLGEAPEKTYVLNDVRAAFAVLTARDGQAKAIEAFKEVSGLETFAKLKPEQYAAVFKRAIPSGELSEADVRAVLVAANNRKSGTGIEILKGLGFTSLQQLTAEKYVEVILAGHKAQ